jgi:hypothetical protein
MKRRAAGLHRIVSCVNRHADAFLSSCAVSCQEPGWYQAALLVMGSADSDERKEYLRAKLQM